MSSLSTHHAPAAPAGADEVAPAGGRGDHAVFACVMAAAAVVTAARLVAPFEVGKDQALQLEAAQRLVQGLGLTSSYFRGPASSDLSVVPDFAYLTWWPPGFSLLVAGFLSLGFTLLVSLKVIYGATTLAGWAGWATLAARHLARPVPLGSRKYPIHVPIALLLPVFTTPQWDGTDIFLWAGVPAVLLLLHSRGGGRPVVSAAVAGLVVGALCSIRYASAFMALAALLILAQAHFPGVRPFLARAAAFFLAASVFILPTLLYTALAAPPDTPVPKVVTIATDLPPAPHYFERMVQAAPAVSVLVVGSPIVELGCSALGIDLLSRSVGVASMLVVFLLPAVVFWSRGPTRAPVRDDVRLGVALLPLSLVVFFLALRLVSHQDFLGVSRYYEPVSLCVVLVSYDLVSRRAAHWPLRVASGLVVLTFLAYLAVYFPALALLDRRQAELTKTVLGYTPSRSADRTSTSHDVAWPSTQIYSLKESSRRALTALCAENPDAVFFLANHAYYVYDCDALRRPDTGAVVDVRRLPRASYFADAYTRRPLKTFWVLEFFAPADFLPEAGRGLVFSDPVEKTKIYESDLPAGYRFGVESGAPPTAREYGDTPPGAPGEEGSP